MAAERTNKETLGKLLRTNKRLERELTRIDSVFNAIRSAIIVADKRGRIQFANSYAEKSLALGGGTVSLFKLLPGIEDVFSDFFESKGELVLKEFEITYPEYKMFSAQIIPFESGDDIDTFAVIMNDVTKEKQSAQERIESEKIASVINLASGIAHELGNPLNSISIHLQLAKRKLGKLRESSEKDSVEAIIDSVDVCTSEVSRLNSIIENFLKAMRPMHADLCKCDPIKPLLETLKVLHEELCNKNISVEINIAKMPPICGDANLLKQLYFNILKNAMEAMTEGGSIAITALSTDAEVEISFADTGCGIDEEGLNNLFQPHYTTKENGHGIGLTIMQAIVRAHDGKISVKSARGKGTTITVSIPRNERCVRMLSY